MLQDAADVVHAELAHAPVAVAREERLLALPDRLVDVHAAAVVAEDRLRHEGRRLAIAAGDVLDDVLVPHERVAHLDQRQEAQVDLGLPGGRHLVVVLLHAVADLLHFADHLGADVLLRVGGLDGEVALLVTRLVAQVLALDQAAAAVVHRVDLARRVPLPLGRVDQVEAGVLVLLVAHLVEDEELGLGPEVGGVADPGRLQVRLGLARDVARVARVVLLGERIDDVADEAQGGKRRERIHHRGGRIRHHEHVRGVDRLPAADRRAVEAESFLEHFLGQLTGRNREVLPESQQVEELQVRGLDLVVLRELEHVLRCLNRHTEPLLTNSAFKSRRRRARRCGCARPRRSATRRSSRRRCGRSWPPSRSSPPRPRPAPRAR